MSLFSHFTPGSAFARKVKGFCGLVFRGINKIQNSHEIETCIVMFCILWCVLQKHLQNTKYEKCIVCLTRHLAKSEKLVDWLYTYRVSHFASVFSPLVRNTAKMRNVKKVMWNTLLYTFCFSYFMNVLAYFVISVE